MSVKRINLNLATRPQKNRRLFYLTCGLLVLVFFLLVIHSGITLFRYKNPNKEAQLSLFDLERRMGEIKKEKKDLASLVEKEAMVQQPRIDLINSVILKKSFSWSGFLSDLEELLPDSCYILSLAPVPGEDQKIEVSMSVAAPSLSELLVFIDRLIQKNYRGIRTMGETRTENGFLLVRMAFTYERSI